MIDVGVGYLALERPLRTLSGGEAQRVALTATLGSSLVDMLYVLDEPSVGLHPADVEPLCRGDREPARSRQHGRRRRARRRDHSPGGRGVEIGPGAGDDGGRVVFQGTPAEMEVARDSRTGDWLAGRRRLGIGQAARRPSTAGSSWSAPAETICENLTVEFPLGVLCLVTGVSGAGKSDARAEDALSRARRAARQETDDDAGRQAAARLRRRVRHRPARRRRADRSDADRPLAALQSAHVHQGVRPDSQRCLPSSRTRRPTGSTAGDFSFNVDGGRCEACQGAGYIAIDMQFMADVYMRCSECGGKRYRRAVLDVKYRGVDIAEVLDMTAREAFTFFRGHKKVQARLKHLIDVGLDYLRLGQPATTLSGGEAQRLKLAAYLLGQAQRPDAVRARRADDRAALFRHRAAVGLLRGAAGRRTFAGDRRAQSAADEGGGLYH